MTATAALPPNVANAFCELAQQQRGEPERAMVRAQLALGGGVLSYAIEHTGDLLHRMNEFACGRFPNDAGYEFVSDKVAKVLRMLRYPYGFAREHAENMSSNARFAATPLAARLQNARRALARYANAHLALRVYNPTQLCARTAAVALGHEEFAAAERSLSVLEMRLSDPETWVEWAWAYQLDERGELEVVDG